LRGGDTPPEPARDNVLRKRAGDRGRMRSMVLRLLLLALAARVGAAGEVPTPLFWESEADFLKQVEEGQFNDRLELHLVQYSADPRWHAEWAAQRYSGNGLFGEYGSTESDELFVNSQIAINLFPAKRLQMRYDRREYQDGRFDVSDQRIDALWYAGSGWALMLSGWPTAEKEYASMGLGVRIGAPRNRNALELTVVDERFVWNKKAESSARFSGRPIRLLADGYYEVGPWRAHGSIDYGLEYEAAEAAAGGASPGRSTRGFQRFADVAVEYAPGNWGFGARVTSASLLRSQQEGTGQIRSLDRSWGRVILTARKDLGRWAVYGLGGFAAQRDEFSSPAAASGGYRMDAALLGAEGGLRAAKGLDLRLGYLGTSQSAQRTVSDPGSLPDREEDLYLDKAHLRAIYTFSPGMSMELLLSQALSGGSFGGGSIKALLVF
jgi:hypothetical protein